MTALSKINKSKAINILIIRMSSIGDIFHAFTVLSDIKTQLPKAQIDWLVDDNFVEIAKLSPLIDNLLTIPMKSWKNQSKWQIVLNILKWGNANKTTSNNKYYDYVIDMQGLIKTGLMTKMFNGNSYGLNSKSAKEGILASIFYNHVFSVNRNQVAIKRFRSLACQALGLEYNSSFSFQIQDKPLNIRIENAYIVLLHGTSKSKKQWSLENWVSLAIELLKNTSYKICISYSSNTEKQFVESITQLIVEAAYKNPAITLENFVVLPQLPIAEFAYLIKNASLVVGVDTGFTHLANLLHRPVIGIYLTPNQHYGGLLSDNISFNLVCDNSHQEHFLVLAIINQFNLVKFLDRPSHQDLVK